MKIPNVDMRRAPYRGIYTELAEELGVSREAIRAAVTVHKNPRIIHLVAERVEQRKQEQRQAERRLRNAAA